MKSNLVKDCELEIDSDFNSNPLNEVPYSQAVWTILSVIEDKFLKFTNIDKLPLEQLHIHADVYLNALTHPLRSLFFNNKQTSGLIKNEVVDEHYRFTIDWLAKAEVYDNFCSIFPLWRNGKIELSVEGEVLNTSDYKNNKIEYEAYNRLRRKDGGVDDNLIDPNEIVSELMPNVSFTNSRFKLNLNPKIAKLLIEKYSSVVHGRYNLPSDWACANFKFGEFREVFTALQAVLYGRFIARTILAMHGMKGLGYPDAVWVVSMPELVYRFSRYTSIKTTTVESILNYITFGGAGIRNPDVATQPILDLKNGYCALSPFVFMNSNSERNLCALLNQIDHDKLIYSKLTQQKEDIMRDSLIKDISALGYEVASGDLGDTDLDLAIIDRKERVCVSFELKWFIEPAEIREVIQRSIELKKGVSQALKIFNKFENSDERLIKDVLNIDQNYAFAVSVGSKNWIGHFDVQSQRVPIIKIRHFMEELRKRKSLKSTLDWLLNREYLPIPSVDFEVMDIPLRLGKWKSSWYGIMPRT